MGVRSMCSHFGLCVLSVMPILAHFVASAPKCNDSDLKGCMDELKVLTNNQDLAFAQTENELTQTCRHLQDAMKCVNSFTSRCFDDAQQDLYRTLTSGAQQLLADLCTQGSGFRAKYLIHAGCYRNLSAEYRQCADSYLLQQESAKKEEMSVEDKLRKSCCLFDGYRECTRFAVLHKCSPEAADLGEQIVSKAGGPLVQTHCKKFKHNTPDCWFNNTLALSLASHSLAQCILLLVTFLSIIYAFSYR